MKKLLLLVAFLMVAGSGWSMQLFATLNPPQGGEDDFILAPIGSIEFNPSTPNNYGLAISESIAFAKVLPGQDSNHVVVSPYAFFGIFVADDIGQWVSTNGGSAMLFDYGIMVGLPKLDESIPEVAFSVNFRNQALMVNVAFPADILSSVFVHKL